MSNAASLTKRDTARNSIRRYMVSSKKAESFDAAEIDVYLGLLAEQWDKFQAAQQEVELSCGAETIAEQESEREQGETWYREALTNFTRARNKIKNDPPGTSKEVVTVDKLLHAARTDIRLPPMKLPCFDGNSKEWKPFEDAFTAFIHGESSISSVQKLHFLLSSLQGPALQVVKGFRITSNNYDEVWELLKKRYDSTRIIVDSHFQALFSLKKINTESSAAIRCLLDETQEHFRSLKAIGRPVDNWDDWLLHLTISKLDIETHRQWELTQTGNKVANFNELVTFLENRCRSLDAIICHQQTSSSKNQTSQQVKGKKSSSLHCATPATAVAPSKKIQGRRFRRQVQNHVCPYCSGKHFIFTCDKFRSTEVPRRISFANDNNLCSNCLGSGHNQTNCQSKYTCRVCNAHHHTLLHCESPSDSSVSQTTSTPSFTPAYASHSKHYVLLGTAMVQVMDKSNRPQPARLLFDNGSHASFISESCVQRLHLRRTSVTTAIEGIGATDAGSSKGEVELTLTSLDQKFSTTINAQILNKITSHLPPVPVHNYNWPHISGLALADPCFNIPAAIDLLIGSDELSQFLCTGLIKGPVGTPIAQNSTLGWVLMGKVSDSTPMPAPVPTYTASSLCLFTNAALTKAVSRLWEIESLPEV
ncbi:uncharacterized protein LOC129917161 [Episyrphus balteatus]|nr:uncharacterized protein LOC129917161 [Episyrphus balteatus]